MSIQKNEIPVLEFDTNPIAVLMPDHDKLNIKLPEKAVFAFLYDEVDKYALKHNAKKVSEYICATKNFPIYVVEYEGEEICLVQAPVGAASATGILDWLIGYGVKKVISAGSCGSLVEIEENVFLIPSKALRDEGTSYHYLAPSRYVNINETVREAIKKTLISEGIEYKEVMTWSTDGFYRETKEKIEYRVSEGCSVVEMECSALAACSAFRGILWGQILYTADSLSNILEYDSRDFGEKSREYALILCLKVLKNL